MALTECRRPARLRDGELVLLADQNRALWDPGLLGDGLAALDRARALGGTPGPYTVQAEIASLHCEPSPDWAQIAARYGELEALPESPVVALNRAVAIAEAEGPERRLDAIAAIPGLEEYQYLHSTRAELLRRVGRLAEAGDAYGRALELVRSDVERRFLTRRLAEVRRGSSR